MTAGNFNESIAIEDWSKMKHKLLAAKTQRQNHKFLFVREIYKEHQNILTAIHDQDGSVNLPSGSRQGRLLLEPFNINYTVIWKQLSTYQSIIQAKFDLNDFEQME